MVDHNGAAANTSENRSLLPGLPPNSSTTLQHCCKLTNHNYTKMESNVPQLYQTLQEFYNNNNPNQNVRLCEVDMQTIHTFSSSILEPSFLMTSFYSAKHLITA